MGKMYDLLYGQFEIIPTMISGLSVSFSNVFKMLGSSFNTTSDSIMLVYLETIKYYNAGFVKTLPISGFTGNEIITLNYQTHINSIFANDSLVNNMIVGRGFLEKITRDTVLMNFPTFVLFLLIGENRNIRKSFLNEMEAYIHVFVEMIYEGVEYTFKERTLAFQILPCEDYKKIAHLQVFDIMTRARLNEEKGFGEDIFLFS